MNYQEDRMKSLLYGDDTDPAEQRMRDIISGGRNEQFVPSRPYQGPETINLYEPDENLTVYDDFINRALANNQSTIDKNLIYRMMKQESGGNPNAYSPAGAQGLLQLMPETAETLGVTDRADPEQNINGAVKLVTQLMQKYNGDQKKVLAAYNGGESGVDKATAAYGENWLEHLDEFKGINSKTGRNHAEETWAYIDAIESDVPSGPKLPTEEKMRRILGIQPQEEEQRPARTEYVSRETPLQPQQAPVKPEGVLPQELPEQQRLEAVSPEYVEKMGKMQPLLPEYEMKQKLTPEEMKQIAEYQPKEPMPEITKEDKKKLAEILIDTGNEHLLGKIVQMSAAFGRGVLQQTPGVGTILGEKFTESPMGEALTEKHKVSAAAGGISSNIIQALGGGAVVGKVLGGVIKSPTVLNTLTRAVTTGGSTALKQDWENNFVESALNTLQAAGAGAVSVVPEIYGPANAWQLLLQPTAGALYDISVDLARGRTQKAFNTPEDRNAYIQEKVLNAALDLGFAIKDVESGKEFKISQKTQRAEIDSWINKNGEKGFEIKDVEVDPATLAKREETIANMRKAFEKKDIEAIEERFPGRPEVPKIEGEGEFKPAEKVGTLEGKRLEGYKPTEEELEKLPQVEPEKAQEIKIEPPEVIKAEGYKPTEEELAKLPEPEKKPEEVKLTEETTFDINKTFEESPEAKLFISKPKKPILESEQGSVAIPYPKETGSTPTKPNEIFNKLKAKVNELFTKEGGKPKEVFVADIERRGEYNSTMLDVSKNVNDFYKATDNVFGKRDLTPEETYTLNEVLNGNYDVNKLPEDLKTSIKNMRQHIDDMGEQLKLSGATTDDLNIAIDQNKGIYVTRTFKKHTDPEWAQHVPEEARNAGRNYIRQELETNNTTLLDKIGEAQIKKSDIENNMRLPGADEKSLKTQLETIDKHITNLKEQITDPTEDNIDAIVESIIRTQESPVKTFMEGVPLGKKRVDILKHRKEMAVEIRALMGEEKNPVVNYVNSVSKISQIIANQNFLNKVVREGENKFLFKKPTKVGGKFYVEKMGAKESKTFDPLSEYYTTKEIKEAFYREENTDSPAWLKLWMKGIYATKAAKTIYYPQTHFKNFFSNTSLGILNGHYKIWEMSKAAKALSNMDYGLHKKLIELGVVGESVQSNDLKMIAKDAGYNNMDYLLGKRHQRLAKKYASIPEKLYAIEDDLWKATAWLNEKAAYKKAFPGKTEAEIEKMAADIVRTTWPTYSQIPKAIRELRKFPLVGTFVNFNYEILRTSIGTFKQAATELAKPETRLIGTRRISGIATYIGLLTALGIGGKLTIGIGKEEDKKVKKFAAPWDKNGLFFYYDKDREGNYSYVNMSRYIPHQGLTDAYVALLNNEDYTSKIAEASAELFQPFISDDIFTEKLWRLRANQKKGGGKVYDPLDTPGNIAKDITLHFAEALEPGIVTSGRRVAMGLTGKETYFKKYEFVPELIGATTGFRASKTSTEKSFRGKIFEFKKNKMDISRYKSTKDVERAFNLDLKLYDDFYNTISDAKYLGVKEDIVRSLMRENGLSRIETNNLIDGTYREYLSAKYSLYKTKNKK